VVDLRKYKEFVNINVECNINIIIQRIWNMKCFVIPVITVATGIVSKSLQKYLETIPGQHSIDSLQKTAILGTSHIIRKVLQAETWSLSGVVHHWLKSRSTREERKPVTRNDDDNNNNNKAVITTYINNKDNIITVQVNVLLLRIILETRRKMLEYDVA
jgi:hypothetical protein